MRVRSFLSLRVLALLSVCFALTAANAQYRAAIQGTVTDPTGAVVGGAKITVTDQATNKTSEATSNADGFYSVTNLAGGLYTVSAEAPGFKKRLVKDAVVAGDLTLSLNLGLVTGGATEQVVVTGESVPVLQTEDANLSATISSQDVQALPQFRGDPFELLRITPGVFGLGARNGDGTAANLPNYSGTGGSIWGIYQTENSVQVSANGQRVDANGYTLDGVSTNSQAHGGATVITPNQESVQEVKVEVNAYDAENGHSAGALVQTITKSGTNSPHGSFGFREHAKSLNAYQRWGGPNSCGKLTSCQQRENLFIRNYFGSLGGPIWKNKVFAFFSFDHMRTYASETDTGWVETPQYISLLTSGSIAAQYFAVKGSGYINAKPATPSQAPCVSLGLTEGTNCISVGTNQAHLGTPTGGPGVRVSNSTGGGLNVANPTPDFQFISYTAFGDRLNGSQYNGRLDYQATSKDLVAFSIYKAPLVKTFLPGGWVADDREYDTFHSDIQRNVATALWTRTINSTLINEARVNVTHWYFDELHGNPQAPWGLPAGNIAVGNPGMGVGFLPGPGVFHQATYAVRDTLSKVHNSHVMKFGFGFDKEQNNDKNAWGAHPSYNFNNLWSFMNDDPDSQGGATIDPNAGVFTTKPKYIRVNDFALFAQDNWKVRPTLTLTLGLRWDYFTPLHDTQNSLSHIVLGQGANTLTDLKVVQGGDLSKADKNNFGPQFRFAWSPRSLFGHDYNNRMVWRGGFGVAYTKIGETKILSADQNPPSFVATGVDCTVAGQCNYATSTKGAYSFLGYPAVPLVQATWNSFNANGLPTGPVGVCDPNTGNGCGKASLAGPVQNMRTPYTFHYSLEMQYDLGHEWTTSLSYQGSQSRKLERTLNYNLFTQTRPQIFAPNPLVNSISLTQSDANSSYNALLARVSHKFSHGLEMNVNYRWSRSIDFCSYDENCGSQQSYPLDQRFERGPSDFDVTHSLTGYAVYELPFFKGRHDFLKSLAGGWRISSIVSLNSGFPWSPVFSYNGSTCNRLTLQGISCTARPATYVGGAGTDYRTSTFQQAGGNFPKGGFAYFTPLPPGVNIPGVGRNSFRGPRYTGIDMGFGKRFTLPKLPLLGEDAGIEVKATAFNIFNKVNVLPFAYNSGSTQLGTADPDSFPGGCTVANGCIHPNATFGRGTGAYSGRVFELTARFSF